MKGKYKPKPKKREKPDVPPPLIVIEKFETYMFGSATDASFEFKNISEEEFKQMIINRKIESYIRNNEIAEALSKVTRRTIKTKSDRCFVPSEYLYRSDKFTIVQKADRCRDNDDLNYFVCKLSGDGGRRIEGFYIRLPFEDALKF